MGGNHVWSYDDTAPIQLARFYCRYHSPSVVQAQADNQPIGLGQEYLPERIKSEEVGVGEGPNYAILTDIIAELSVALP